MLILNENLQDLITKVSTKLEKGLKEVIELKKTMDGQTNRLNKVTGDMAQCKTDIAEARHNLGENSGCESRHIRADGGDDEEAQGGAAGAPA